MSFVHTLGREGKETDEDDISESPIFNYFIRPSLAEFIASGFLTYASILSVSGEAELGRFETGLCEGLMILGLSVIFAPISGAHLNPIVSLGACICGGLRLLLLPFFIIAQYFGAFIGALLARGTLLRAEYIRIEGNINVVNRAVTSRGKSVTSTALLGGLLVLSYVMVSLGRGAGRGDQSLRLGVVMGSVGALGTLLLGPLGLNPARALAASAALSLFTPLPAWELHWVLTLGPTLGAVVAALLYRLVLGSHAARLKLFPNAR